jgi:class 3 adenylate cyclase
VETIQRLKREGWSINRIADHFSGRADDAAAPAPSAPPPSVAPARLLETAAGAHGISQAAANWHLSLGDFDQPTYLVDDGFRLLWVNEPARTSALSPLVGQPAAVRGSIFPHLLALDAGGARDAILQFHLETAKDRAAAASDLFSGLGSEPEARLQALFRQARTRGASLVQHASIPPSGDIPGRLLHAVHFREAVAFAYLRQEPGAAVAVAPAALPARAGQAPTAPAVTSIGVLVSTLQDANALWVKLTAHEYFELVNEVSAELDPIFRRHGGQPGRHPDEGLVCYFLPQPGGSYVWNALAAAHAVQDAMRQVSLRWQARKGWDFELCMNTGLDEGQDWMGAIGAGGGDLRVLGDAADRAEQLSRCARLGAVLVTRSLLGKLADSQRRRIVYGVPRPAGTAAGARLLSSFARLADLAPAGTVPPRVADLPVAELLAIDSPAAPADPHGLAA